MSFGRARGTMGQAVYCRGAYAVGGAVTWAADGKSATILPDDDISNPVTLVAAPGWSLNDLYTTYRSRPRVAFSGDLLSNNTLISDGGAGSLMANEFFKTQERGPCRTYLSAGYAAAPETQEPAPPPPPPAWTGTQEATVQVVGGGVPSNVTVYAADGRSYKLASSSDSTNAQELATTAPQGPALSITGRWDPAAGTVSVSSWFIVATGDKKYGVEPETGEVVPQRPDIPSTDWPGGPVTPPEETQEPQATPGSGGGAGGASSPSPAAPASASWGILAVILGAALMRRGGSK